MEKYILAVCLVCFFGCDDADCWEGSLCVSDYADVPEETSPERFNITLVFGEGTPMWLKEAAHAAARRWEEVITGDLIDVTAEIPQGECGNDADFRGDIDDIVIFVSLDETLNSGVFGLGGSCWSRRGGLPFAGRVRINPEADYLVGQGTMGNLVAHEIGHALGFVRNRFESEGLVSGGGKYCGDSAVSQYELLGGQGCIPLDKSGSHWTEAEFGEEIMTTRLADIRGSRAPISTVTIGVFDDLGYEVNYSAADSFGL